VVFFSGENLPLRSLEAENEIFKNIFSVGTPKREIFASIPSKARNFAALEEKTLIAGCKSQDRRAQKALYDLYASKMLGLCKRYLKDKADAEDTLLKGFFKVLTLIDRYEGKGSFEGWIRKIMVNECLMVLRQRLQFPESSPLSDVQLGTADDPIAIMAAQDLVALMDTLPEGYRTVLNLYAVEGYLHREIAEMLGISINTSKSQLLLAKQRLRTMIGEHIYPEAG
jgi:RNA polymerase sigma factor (sigma-70 family)